MPKPLPSHGWPAPLHQPAAALVLTSWNGVGAVPVAMLAPACSACGRACGCVAAPAPGAAVIAVTIAAPPAAAVTASSPFLIRFMGTSFPSFDIPTLDDRT